MKTSNGTRRLKPAPVAALLVGGAFAMLSAEARGQFADSRPDTWPDNLITWLSFMPAGCDTSECLRSYRQRDGDVITLKIEHNVVATTSWRSSFVPG
jgi:hypothetical protein